MKRFCKVALCVLLALTMTIPTGCGKNTKEETMNKDTVYSETDLNLGLPQGFEVNTLAGNDEKLVITGYVYNETDYTSVPGWCVANSDGSDYKYYPIEGNGWIERALLLSNGNIAIFRSETYEDNSDPENYVYESYYYLDIYDTTGSLLSETNLAQEVGFDWVSYVLEIENGDILVSNYNLFAVLDSNGKLKSKKEVQESNYSGFYKLKDGTVIASRWGDTGMEIVRFDTNTFEAGEQLSFDFNIERYSLLGFSEKYDMLLSNNTGIYGYNIGDAEPTEILDFVNSDLTTSYFSNLISLKNGDFIANYYDWTDETYSIKICRYTKVDPSTIPDRKIITLGCLWISDEIRKQVIDFNKASDTVRINVKDYSMYESQENWNGGTERLNSDIASGQSPDIIVANDSSVIGNYEAKGLFLDLTKYIENDSQINKDDIFPNLMEATSYKGKIYEIIPSFYVQTLAAKTSRLNGMTSWNFDEFMKMNDSLSEGQTMFGAYSTRDSVLGDILAVNGTEFVDTQNGKCYLDSEGFIKVLELANKFPKEIDDSVWEYYNYEKEMNAYRNDDTLLYFLSLSRIEEYNNMVKSTFGEDVTLIGYPSSEGNGSVLYYYNSFAISSKCKQPDAAWEFVRTYLTPEYQSKVTYGIPASMSRFDELAEEAQKPVDTDGDQIGAYVYDMGPYGEEPVDPITAEECAELKNFILSVNKVMRFNNDVMDIILEEAEPYFEGQKSVEDVVKIMQSRVSIFLSEKQ